MVIPFSFLFFRGTLVRQFYLRHAHVSDESVADLQNMTACLAILVAVLIGSAYVGYNEKRVPVLHCPTCGKCLVNSVRLAIATKNCPYCGNRVLFHAPTELS